MSLLETGTLHTLRNEGVVRRKRAPVTHFPFGQRRDEYGNRFLRSPRYGYTDNDGDVNKFGLLVSREGEIALKTIPDFLRTTEYLALKGRRGIGHEQFDALVGEVSVMNSEQSSQCYQVVIADVNNTKYVLRWRNPLEPVSQPMHHEMLQIQAMKQDLAEDLAKIGVSLPTYLYASPLIACRLFEEGEDVYGPDIQEVAKTLNTIVRRYIDDQVRSGKTVWNNVAPDSLGMFDKCPRGNNFVRKSDNSLCWFDPLLYHPPGLQPAADSFF